MNKDENTPQPTATASTQQPKPRRRKLAALAVGGLLLVSASSFAASMAGAAMAGDRGPEGAPAASAQSECPDGPPAGAS